jgi:gliding motility-associated-like protein
MKKLLTLLVLFFTLSNFSQVITVDTNTYTVPQLVNSVLINSPCINASNISWRTGTNFGSANGIGYFQNTNPNFPIQSGVILSTGNVMNSPGPNTSTLNNGSMAWTGDAQLESTLLASGITMNSVNATVLEFDFTPLSPYFDFDFLFASEEYGNFQCQFSDAFAFLLTNLTTGVTTNLAVVPGTTNPISVVTIRDFLYNSTCPSANAQYFGSYNGGTNAASAPINFNGQTKVMNAAAVLTPNTPYRIKLVIADRGDFQSDSAIFLSSNSFNIGQNVLGDDLTQSSNSAVCYGQNYVINSGLNPANFIFIWKKDGVLLPLETGPTLNVTQPGTYELTYNNISFPCQSVTDTVVVEYEPVFSTPNPINLYKCNVGSSSYTYNLDMNTPIVKLGLNPGVTVSYHSSLSDANNNINPLPLAYSSAGGETIFVRINKDNSTCYTVKSFQLLVSAPPVANQPLDFIECEHPLTPGINWFNLSVLTPQVLQSQSPSIYTVNYYLTAADANANTNAIVNPNINTSNTTVYIRVHLTTDSSCYSVTSVNLVLLPLPLVDHLEDVITCINYILPALTNGNYFTGPGGTGTPLFAGDVITQTQTIYIYNLFNSSPSCDNESSFRVTIIKPEELSINAGTYCTSYSLPANVFGDYYTGPGGTGTIIADGTVITSSQTVYYYYQSTSPPFCVLDLSFDIVIVNVQQVPTLTNAFDCTTYILQPLAFGEYYDAPNGTGNQIPVGTAITSSKTIYIHGLTGTCPSDSNFEVVIGINFPTSLTECSSYTLPQLTVGNYFTQPLGAGTPIPAGTVINATQTIYVYAVTQSSPNCTDNYNFTVTIALPTIPIPAENSGCQTFALPALTVGDYYTGSGGTGTLMHAGDIISSTQTLYIYLNDNNGCQNEVSYSITVLQPPVIDSRSEIDACHSYTLTNLANGNYYTGPNGSGTLLNGGTILTSSQLIYIYASQNGCSIETNFQLNVYTITAFQAQNVSACDSYTLPPLVGNNKYYTQPGGQYGTGTEILPGTVITSTQTIYIFIESGERINCTDEKSFTVTVIPTPVVNPIANVNTCNSYTLPTLTVGNYFTQTGGTGTQLNAGDIITTNQTLYVYAETATTPNCFDEKSFTLTIFNVEDNADVTICENYILPALTVGNYYNGPNGTGGSIPAGTSISTSKTIYVFAYSGFSPNCSDESSFNVTIIDTPVANLVPLTIRTVCDEDGTNDGITSFDLNTLNSAVLGTQTGAEFSLAYYASFNDANANTNAITSTLLTTVYVRVNNSLAPNCYDIKPITIIVNKLPEATPEDGIVCIDSETGNLLNPYVIESGLSGATHTFQWFDATGAVIGHLSTQQVVLPGSYSVIATNNATGCSSVEMFVNVNASEPAVVAYSVSEDFSYSQTVTITATGTGGEYEYQLDDGPFQDSPVFDQVPSGIHTITVRDKFGCGITTVEAIVVNYPKYFTPNGDGFNETWNIVDLKEQENAIISIFDRFGKLLKQIKPSGQGWDGKYNGKEMISDDYWFTITYTKNQKEREFKAHFALKR